MMEIYCEKVRDLFSSKVPPKGGLKIREHPKTGFYGKKILKRIGGSTVIVTVEELSNVPMSTYKEIEAKIEEGTRNRTIAATNMNATSSRYRK